MRFEGKTALVTGGAGGIGKATAERLAAEGAGVWVADINEQGADEVAAEIDGKALAFDVSDPAAVSAAVQTTGGVDILINNAGTDMFAFFGDTDDELWQRVIGINLVGVLACTRAALPAMREKGYGRIVNTASEAGRVGSKGSATYSAAKGGVIAFTKALAREEARYGITVNAVAPGPIETPLLMGALGFGDVGKKVIETMTGATQLRRLGKPEEVAAAIAFLASDDASYVTGETLGVSGGLGMAS